MYHNKKIINNQKKLSKNKLKNSNLDFIQNYINPIDINNTTKSRNRIYTPERTLSMFILQSLNQDSSCQNRVNRLAMKKDKKVSLSTSAYCQARTRLSTSMIRENVRQIGINNEKQELIAFNRFL